MDIGVFVVGIVSGYIAFSVGKWRRLCMFFDVRAPFNVPLGWHHPLMRYGSWLLVVVTSLLFATCLAKLITESVYPLVGKFSWGVLLTARWLASGIAANKEGFRQLAKLESISVPPASTASSTRDSAR
jgi:hypothetical protein